MDKDRDEASLISKVTEIDRYDETPDDLLGVTQLVKPELVETCPTLPAYDRACDITATASRLSGAEAGLPALGNLQISQ